MMNKEKSSLLYDYEMYEYFVRAVQLILYEIIRCQQIRFLKMKTCFVTVSAPPSTSPSPSTTENLKKGKILETDPSR